MFPYTVENNNNKPSVIIQLKEKTIDFLPEELSAIILMKIKERAEEVLKTKVTKAVITVPSHFNGIQRQATIDAGQIAGLKVLRIINEPTSSILAFDILTKNENRSCNVLVYDFGGGTFDVTIATICNNEIQVTSLDIFVARKCLPLTLINTTKAIIIIFFYVFYIFYGIHKHGVQIAHYANGLQHFP